MTEPGNRMNPSKNKEINCVSEDCIPFHQVGASSNAENDVSDEVVDRGNGRTPRVWISRHRTHPFGRRSQLIWIRILSVLLVLLLVLLIVFISLWASQRKQLQGAPCLEPACIKSAADIITNMDSDLSPCENFYEYACSGWENNNHIPQGQNQWSILKILSKNVEYFTKDILENETSADASHGLKLAQVYYNSCMNESWVNRRGFDPLYDHLRLLFDGWVLLPTNSKAARLDNGTSLKIGTFNLTQSLLSWFHTFGMNHLFKVGVSQDIKNSSNIVIELGEGYLSMHRENYLNETHTAHVKTSRAFRNFMRNYSLLLGVPSENLWELDEVYVFEKYIAMRTEDRNERDPEKNFLLSNLIDVAEMCPVLDWHILLSKMFAPLNYTIKQDEPIALSDHEHFKERCELFMDYMKNDSGIRVLHNAAVWQFLWRTESKMPSIVSRTLEEFREADTGLQSEPPRWLSCVTETQSSFSSVVSRVYIKEKFNQKKKDAVIGMISEIRQAFKDNFATVDWMLEEDKVKAIEKVDLMKASVAFPEDINDLSEERRIYGTIIQLDPETYLENFLKLTEVVLIDQLYVLITKNKDRWELSPYIVNAFYKENANHIYFPAGILQSPLFNHEHPKSLNFGAIGTVIGHEILHAFDQFGSKRDAYGNLRQWWSAETREAFERHSQCMIDQYGNYSILNTSLNGKMTLGENIADNGGLKASYKAFKKLEAQDPDRPILPGLNMSSDQLFFLSFAQLWCVKTLPRSMLNTVLFDVHTVEPYRVIGTLSNSEDFARVFNCPVGSPMNPVKKCVIW
ncbi:Endothelin-converting enzyme [Paragonimus heterotremus]|uniref:Endothelin-converting enzyme n=1 Tax=Paragonimus heterotremus TaxID=100268 RepID=A0A8J4WV13_9TREM|nr:Endothelin-converting enzyme [Paragonimus heterotremus]